MNKIILQLIACLMLLGSVSLLADEQTTASCAEDDYGYGLSAETLEIILLHETMPTADVVAKTAPAKHGQPLPGIMLTVLIAGAAMKAFHRMRRKAQHLQKLLVVTVLHSHHRFISLYLYFIRCELSYLCCWKWQRTVLRR